MSEEINKATNTNMNNAEAGAVAVSAPTAYGNTAGAVMPETKKSRKKMGTAKKVLIIILIIIGALAAGFLVIGTQFRSVFLTNTYIDGINAGRLTPEEVNKLIVAEQEEYTLDITFRDGSTATINGSDFGYTYDATTSLRDILADQVPAHFIYHIIGEGPRYDFESTITTSYDAELLDALCRTLPQFQEENMTNPTNAYVAKGETEFVIVPETEGNKLKADEAIEAIKDAIDLSQNEVVINSQECYEEPSVRSDDETVIEEAAQLNSYLAASITYVFSGYTVVLDRTRLINWLKQDENGGYYKDADFWEENLLSFINEIETAFNSEPNTWEFDITGGGTVTIQGGTLAKSIDLQAEHDQLALELETGTVTERTPLRKDITINHGIGNTYVEIDITRQHLWAYDQGALIAETDIVTGIPTEDRRTPEGVYFVNYKAENVTLRGTRLPDGTYDYESPVRYWMPFNGDIGMHDADWRNEGDFGGEIYTFAGSHGCVNLPVSFTAGFYAWIQPGTIVVVYSS